MPQPARNQRMEDSPGSSTRSNESGLPHDRRTRASRQNALRNSSTRISQTLTDGKTSGGDHIAPRTARDPAPTTDRLAELCNECECYLRPEDKEANEQDATSTARRGRCDDCYRKSPAPIAPMGGPSYSLSTSSAVGAGSRAVRGAMRSPPEVLTSVSV